MTVLVVELFVLALAVMTWAPDTPLGRGLRHWLVDAPIRALYRVSPPKIIMGLIVAVCLIGMAMSAPELVALIGFGDLSVVIDATVIVTLLSAAARLKFVIARTAQLGRNFVARIAALSAAIRPRNRRTRQHRPRLPPSGDGDSAGDWAFA